MIDQISPKIRVIVNVIAELIEVQEYVKNLEAEKKELRSIVKDLLHMAKDGYKLHCKNCCHQDFLEDDREILTKAEQAIKELKKDKVIDFENPPEGYYTYYPHGKYHDDDPILMKKDVSNPDREPNYK